MYTRRVSDPLAVAVDCYAGYRGEQTPRRVTRGNQLVEILAIVERWRTPDHRYFTVRTADEVCTLRQDVSGRVGADGVGAERTSMKGSTSSGQRVGSGTTGDEAISRCGRGIGVQGP